LLVVMDNRRLNPKRRSKKRRSTTMDSTTFQFHRQISASVSPGPSHREPKLKAKRSKTPISKKHKKKGKHKTAASEIVVALEPTLTSKELSSRSRTPGVSFEMDAYEYDIPSIESPKTPKRVIKRGRPKSARKGKKPKVSLAPSGTRLATHDSDSNNIRKRGGHRGTQSARFSNAQSHQLQLEQFSRSNQQSIKPTLESMGKRSKSQQDSPKFQVERSMKLTNSKTISNASKALSVSARAAKRRIGDAFYSFHDALDEQEKKLIDDVEVVHEDKRDDIADAERKLFSNSKRTRKIKEIEFDPTLKVALDAEAVLQLIQSRRFGFVEGMGPGDEFLTAEGANQAATSLDTGISILSPLHENQKQDSCEDGLVVVEDADGWNDGEETPAMLQKKVLGDIQQRTMSVVDTVIEMEKLAKRKKRQAEQLKKEVEAKLLYIDARSKEINDKLEAARPELDKAREAVESIEPRDLNEIKSLKAPPTVIANVMTATAMILGHKIKEWKDVQKILSYKFKPQLLGFDTYSLTKETRQRVYKKFASKEDFNYDRVYEGNKVCGNLVLWVLQQIKYSRILDVIIPLEKELKKLKKEVRKKQKLSKQLLQVVAELEENIKLYTDQCNKMIDEIIKNTDRQLQQFKGALEPLNAKFQELLKRSDQVLD